MHEECIFPQIFLIISNPQEELESGQWGHHLNDLRAAEEVQQDVLK